MKIDYKIFTFIILVAAVCVALISAIEIKRCTRVCFSNNCFNAEIADNEDSRVLGLMFRKSLAKDKSMLFIFNKEGNYPFWMKNTLIPLDIIWINQNKEVVFIEKNAQPCGEQDCIPIDPKLNAKYVLEINGGLAQEKDIKVGDQTIFK